VPGDTLPLPATNNGQAVPPDNVPLKHALTYCTAGLAVIPIRPDGSKRPAISKWETFQKDRPADEDVRAWWKSGTAGIGIIGGAVSGHLECIDFDRGELFEPWRELVEAQVPGLVARLCLVRTPRLPEGYHVRYRCTAVTIPGNTKLASEPGTDPKTGKPCQVTLIETRGEGGYAVAPGSPPTCHPTGRTWDHVGGPPLTELSDITAAEREVLIGAARSFDLAAAAKVRRPAVTAKGGDADAGLRPGDDYDRRGPDWTQILEPHGWQRGHSRGTVVYWRRPGKDSPGISATTGYCQGADGAELLAVFSSNAHPFDGPSGSQPCTCYGKFAAYTLLNHEGDFTASARELAQQGFGTQRPGGNGKSAGKQAVRIAMTCLATIRPVPVRWLVPDYFPLGKLVLLAGDGGHGKSTLTLDLTACLTTGRPCFGLEHEALAPADVLLVCCEDDFADTVVPRLICAGADLNRVWRVDGVKRQDGDSAPFTLAQFNLVEAELRARPEVRLVVIDPAGAYVSGSGVDDYNDSELRGLLGPMSELAARTHVTVVLVKHLIKGATAKAVHKVGGSAGYVNTVRAAFVVAPEGPDSDKKLFLPLKFNLGPRPTGLGYRMRSLDERERNEILDAYGLHLGGPDRERLAQQLFRMEWLGPVDADADRVLGEQARRDRDPNKVERATQWLKQFLATHAYPSDEIKAAAEQNGFTFDNLKEAKARLKAEGLHNSNKGRFGGAWWSGIGAPESWVLRPPTPHTPHYPHNGDAAGASRSAYTSEAPASSPRFQTEASPDTVFTVTAVGSTSDPEAPAPSIVGNVGIVGIVGSGAPQEGEL
jgi:hypothetical protein